MIVSLAVLTDKIITVIIPALNEEKGIRKTITRIPKKEIAELGYELEILVVDGNSTDSTRKIAEECGATVTIEKNPGYGRAYKTGFTIASGGIIVTCDGDGTYPVELIPKYIQHLNAKNLDFITINRLSDHENGGMGFSHLIGNKVLSGVMNMIYSIKVKDSQSGMFIMKKRFLELVSLRSNGYTISEEIKIIAFSFFRSDELDGKYYAREGLTKLSTWSDGIKNLIYLFKFKFYLNNSLVQKNERLIMAQKISIQKV